MTINTSATGGIIAAEDVKWDDNVKYGPYGVFWDRGSPIFDDDLSRFLQSIFYAITQLDPTLVRPRWQPVPPNMPAQNVNWMAFGVERITSPSQASILHVSRTWDQPGARFDTPNAAYTDGSDQTFDNNQNYDTNKIYDVNQPEYDRPGEKFDDGRTFDTDAAALQGDVLYTQEDIELLCSFYGPNASRFAGRLRDGFQIGQNRELLSSKNFGFVSASEMLAVPALINNIWTRRFDLRLFLRRAINRVYPVLDLTEAKFTVDSEKIQVSKTLLNDQE